MLTLQPQRGWLVALLLLIQTPSHAEVQFDGATGAATGLLSGDLTITEEQGLLTANEQALLHSFSEFSVLVGETVEFTHATQTVQDIIARVTGNNVSAIDGRLVSDANLWLLNPNGVLMGEDAQIDVAGSFRANDQAGSGAALILNDGSLVTVDTNLNTLSVAAPADFGFVVDVPADASTKVSADASSGTVVTPFIDGNGHFFDITGGTQVGGNLFHSFDRFSVFADDSAYFTSNSAVALDNVISRVTGGFKSFITGFVTTNGSGMVGTSFWFVNPAGVFAGNGDSIDVGKSLNLGSADFISDSTGAQFRADASGASTFFSGSPAVFGFDVDTDAQALRLSNLDYDQTGRLSNTVDDGISLAGANVELLDSNLDLISEPGQTGTLAIDAPAGQIILTDSNLSSTSQGAVGAGSIELSGARLIANGSRLDMTTAVGDASAAPNRIFLNFSDSILLDGSAALATTEGAGSSGQVFLNSPLLDVHRTNLGTLSSGSGAADVVVLRSVGDVAQISITGDTLIENTTVDATAGAVADGILIGSTGAVSILGSEQTPVYVFGDAGVDAGANASIDISGQNVSLGHVILFSDNAGSTLAPEGSSAITILADDMLSVESSFLVSDTTGVNPTGNFVLAAREISLVDATISTETFGQGSADLINIQADEQISVLGSSVLTSETAATGNSGDVILNSGGDVLVDGGGDGIDVTITARSVAPVNGGNAGSIFVQAANDLLLSNAIVTASADSGPSGTAILVANNIEVQSAEVSTDTGADISSGSGAGFFANDQLVIDDTVITTATSGSADASVINFQGLDIRISNSEIIGSTTGAGNASPILVSGPFDGVSVNRAAEAEIVFANVLVSSETTGEGSYGNINVAGRNILLEGSEFRVQTASMNQGDPFFAAIGFLAADQVELQNSTLTAATTGNSDAGRIVLDSPNTRFTNSIVTNESTGNGSAGLILVAAENPVGPTSLEVIDSELNSDTSDGIGGSVRLVATNVTLTGVGTRVSTNSDGAGTAGTIFIAGENLNVFDGASVESRATGSGDSNTITLQVGDRFNLLSDVPGIRSQIRTDSVQSRGGDVQVDASGLTFLGNAAFVTSAGANGAGGNIGLNVNGLLIVRSAILAQAQAGNGGQIDIDTIDGSVVIIDGESSINADSQAGSSGSVVISAPDSGITSAITPQSTALAPEVSLQRDSCAPPIDGQRASTFFVRASGRQIRSPDAYLGKLGPQQNRTAPEPAAGDCP